MSHAHAHMHPGDGLVTAAPALLADGWYTFDGDASSMLPIEGEGWVSWDGTTDVQFSGLTGSILHVVAAGLDPASWDTTMTWNGSMTEAFAKGDASAMAAMTDTSLPTGSHISWVSGTSEGTFTGEGSDPAHRAIYTAGNATGGNLLLEGSVIA